MSLIQRIISYLLGYKYYANIDLPEPNLRFGLQESTYIKGWSLDESESLPNKLTFKTKWDMAQSSDWMREENQRDLEQQLCVIANMIIANNTKYGQFIFPFFVRYAYRLYDGTTLTMHSAPILMTAALYMCEFCVVNGIRLNIKKLKE